MPDYLCHMRSRKRKGELRLQLKTLVSMKQIRSSLDIHQEGSFTTTIIKLDAMSELITRTVMHGRKNLKLKKNAFNG